MAEKKLDLKNFTIDKLVKSTKRQLPQNFFSNWAETKESNQE